MRDTYVWHTVVFWAFTFRVNFKNYLVLGERGGSVVECRTPEREVRGSRPTAAVLCPWARHFTPRKYWLITQEAMAPSRYDWKIVDWDVKPQHNQPTIWYSCTRQNVKRAASSEFGTYRLCELRRFRRACASVQSRQNLRCSLIQAVSQEEPSDRKPDSWPLWMSGHAQLKFVMTECSKTQIRLTGLKRFAVLMGVERVTHPFTLKI